MYRLVSESPARTADVSSVVGSPDDEVELLPPVAAARILRRGPPPPEGIAFGPSVLSMTICARCRITVLRSGSS